MRASLPGFLVFVRWEFVGERAAIDLLVQGDDVRKAVFGHAAATGAAHCMRFFWIVAQVANGFGESGYVADRNDDSASASEEIADAPRVRADGGNFQGEGFHETAWEAFALGGERETVGGAIDSGEVAPVTEKVNRFAETELGNLRFDFGAAIAFAGKSDMNVGAVEARDGLDDVAMALVAREFGDHRHELVLQREF